MKLFNKILIIVFLPVFMFSSTGLVIVHHTCETCGVSEVLINKEHTHKEDHCMKTEKSCCEGTSCELPKETNNSDCCKEDHFYYIVNEPYMQGSNTTDLQIKVIQLFDYILYEGFETQLLSQSYESSIIKPPDNTGREILRNKCVLRV